MTSTTALKPNVPTVLVVFGATGDLMAKKIGPALAFLNAEGVLPAQLQIIGVARRPLTDAEFRDHVQKKSAAYLPKDEAAATEFLARFHYQQGQFGEAELYQSLAERLGRIDDEWRACSNKLFYLAVPPELNETILKLLAAEHLTEPCSDETGWTRVIVEKPFGKDLKSAEALDMLLGQLFTEEQIYRIDHYLGKDMLQNILNFRFANRLFEPSWNATAIERIDLRLIETLGAEDRGKFYDGVGALRDVGQNHLLQMLALTVMEAPQSLEAANVRAARAAALSIIATPTAAHVASESFRAQYAGYQSIQDVAPTSATETYFKLKLALNGDRWAGVPVWVESGKRLKTVDKAVVVTFKHPEPCLCPASGHIQNRIEFRLEPNPAIVVHFWAKPPKIGAGLEPRTLTFDLATDQERGQYVAEYAQLLLDCIQGDQTSFVETAELKEMWRVVDPFVQGWATNAVPLASYQPDTDTIRAAATETLERISE